MTARSTIMTILAVSTFALFAGTSGVLAGTVFEEKFDAYTAGAYLSVASPSWVISDACNDGKVDATRQSSAPNSVADYKNVSNLRIGIRNRHDLTAAEMSAANVVHDPNPTTVDGTDANPLVFGYVLYLGPKTSNVYYQYLNLYAELSCGDDRAPTPMVTADCGGKLRPHLNLDGDGQVHRSIAVGQIAWSDTDPCDIATNQVAQSYRLTVYDGRRWKILQAPVDVHPCGGYNWVKMTIRTSTIEVALTTSYDGTTCTGNKFTYTATVDREYPGDFTSIKFGGLPKDPADGTGCWGEDNAPSDAYPNQGTYIDDIYLENGEAFNNPNPCGIIPTGACCTGFDCAVTTAADCAAEYRGDGTTCTSKTCCSDPFADADSDGDVDQIDFAAFQLCYTGFGGGVPAGCECFDHIPTGTVPSVDSDDWAAFEVCASGPGIPANAACD